MQARRSLAFLAALLITLGQALIFAVDTGASAQVAEPSTAALLHRASNSIVA